VNRAIRPIVLSHWATEAGVFLLELVSKMSRHSEGAVVAIEESLVLVVETLRYAQADIFEMTFFGVSVV
jgi:hypothetical protein